MLDGFELIEIVVIVRRRLNVFVFPGDSVRDVTAMTSEFGDGKDVGF